MEKKEAFKEFVKINPGLIKHVQNGSMSWQKFYEIYDLYGDKEEAWTDYLGVKTDVAANAAAGITLGSLFNWLKTIDLESVQSGVGNIQRVIGVFQDFSSKDKVEKKEEYKPRPLYKHFDD